MPLARRLPKRGFHSLHPKQVEIVTVAALAGFAEGAEVDPAALATRGLIRGWGDSVKLLGEGEAPRGLRVRLQSVSAGARRKIELAGGSVEIVV